MITFIFLIFLFLERSSTHVENWTTVNPATQYPLQVDITDTQFVSFTSKRLHKTLWYNPPSWLSTENLNELTRTCPVSNCEHTANKKFSYSSSALIFCTIDCSALSQPPLNESERPKNQIWIYFGLESPITVERLSKGRTPKWRHSFNWTMSYQLDSDIVAPYGALIPKPFVENRNFSEIFHRKTKWAAWLVSKCNVSSLRETFVDKLKKYGFPVDIFGRCGKRLTEDPEKMIRGDYKFYLSFENTMCKDYITEKFFKYVRYDTVPVVRGGANYKKLLPDHTYIDTADFNSFESLVDYLKLVGANETLYTTYLRNIARYTLNLFHENNMPFCSLCNKLNNARGYQKTYTEIPNNLEQCFITHDINTFDKTDTPVV